MPVCSSLRNSFIIIRPTCLLAIKRIFGWFLLIPSAVVELGACLVIWWPGSCSDRAPLDGLALWLGVRHHPSNKRRRKRRKRNGRDSPSSLGAVKAEGPPSRLIHRRLIQINGGVPANSADASCGGRRPLSLHRSTSRTAIALCDWFSSDLSRHKTESGGCSHLAFTPFVLRRKVKRTPWNGRKNSYFDCVQYQKLTFAKKKCAIGCRRLTNSDEPSWVGFCCGDRCGVGRR